MSLSSIVVSTGATDAGHPSHDREGGRISTLDGWRAIAILLVLLDHGADDLRGRLAWLDPVAFQQLKERVGLFGVHIFFVLSGYLITSRLIREARGGSISLREFYLRRVFRIQPAALTFLAVVGTLAVAGILPISRPTWLSALLCYANLRSTDVSYYTGHFWSLSIEEQFYLVWPLLFILLGRLRLPGALTLALGLSLWRAVVVKFQITLSAGWVVRTDMQAEHLAWGCALALVQAEPRYRFFLLRLTRTAPRLLSLAVMAAGALVVTHDWKLNHLLSSASAAAIALVLVGTSTHPGSALSRLLELRPLTWLGHVSYSLYLWQQIFFVWSDKRVPALQLLQSFPLNLLAALGAATASYYLIEQPMIRVGRRVARRRRAPLAHAERVTA